MSWRPRSLAQLDRPVLCAELVERGREMGILASSLAALPAAGGLVVLAGEAGVGKTRLLREAAILAGDAGLPVVSGRSVPTTSPVPYRPLTEAFLGAFRDAAPPAQPELDGWRDQLGRLVPDWRTSGAGLADESPVLVAEAVVRLLRVVGGTTGCVLVLEDLHWADDETLAVVEYLADVLGGEPSLCLCTARPESAAVDLLGRLRRSPGVTFLAPARLEPTGIERAVASCLGAAVPPADVVAAVASSSEGIPFLIEELLAGLVASGSLRLDEAGWTTSGRLSPSVPFNFAESVRQRLGALDATGRRVLGAAALLGRRFDWELIPGIAEVDGRAAAEALRSAVDQQLIDVDGDGFVFRHALTREAVLDDLLPPERRELSVRAWPVLERANPGLPGAVLELAADLAEAAGDPVAAAGRLVESARRAMEGGALASAETTARRARALAGDHPSAVDADEVLVEALAASGKSSEAIDLGRTLAGRFDAGTPRGRTVDLLVAVVRAALAAGDVSVASDVADEARAALGDPVDPALLARVDTVAAEAALDRGDLHEAERLAVDAVEGARVTDQAAVLCEALLVLGRVVRPRGTDLSQRCFEEAASVAQAAGLARWHLRAQQETVLEAWSVDGLAPLQETCALAARYGALVTVAVMDLTIADAALTDLDAAGCLAAATACVEASRRYGLATCSVSELWLAGAHAIGGDDDAMRAAIDASLAHDPTDPRILADLYGRVLITRAFVRDELDAIRSLADRAMPHVRAASPTLSVYPGRTVWALLRTIDDDDLGEPARAELAERMIPMGYPLSACVDLVEAVALGRTGDRHAASARAEAAHAELAGVGHMRAPLHCYTLLIARAAIRDGWGDAARWLRAAEAFFVERGHEALARRARLMLVEAGAPVPRRRGATEVPHALRALGVTGREMDVLRLVIEGRTTKDIARTLFLSPKTVERHLSSLFTRLDVHDRRRLAEVGAALLP